MSERHQPLIRVEPRIISSLKRSNRDFFREQRAKCSIKANGFDTAFGDCRENLKMSKAYFQVVRTTSQVQYQGQQDCIKEGADNMGMIRNIKEEIRIIRERDPAIHSSLEVFLYPSFKVMLHYRLAHRLYQKGHYFLARYISQRGVRKTGIEIHPGAQIGSGFFIDHGNGVIIGETAIIGNNVTLYQGVTLGGTGKEHGKRHPTIGDNVMISAGAKVLGSFTIGENSKIGAGSVVLSEVPPNSTVVGVPGRVVKRNNVSMPRETLNQTDLPDPVKEEIANLQHYNADLGNRLLEMEEELKHLKKKVKKQEKELSRKKVKVKKSASDQVEKRTDSAEAAEIEMDIKEGEKENEAF